MSFDIHIAQTEAELTELYQLRYKVYVEELGRTQIFADHDRQEIKEPLDETADNMIAVEDGRIVGAMRFNFCNNTTDTLYRDIYRLEMFQHFYPHKVSFNTKLIVTPTSRKRNVPLEIAMAVYKHRVNEVNFNIIDCYPVMVPFYLKFGYRFYTSDTVHPEFGEVVPLVLVKDVEYLKSIGSRLAAVETIRTEEDEGCIEFFNENFGAIHQERLQVFQEKNQMIIHTK